MKLLCHFIRLISGLLKGLIEGPIKGLLNRLIMRPNSILCWIVPTLGWVVVTLAVSVVFRPTVSKAEATAASAATEVAESFQGVVPEISTEMPLGTEGGGEQKFNLSFLTIFYGPSLSNPSRLQPNSAGEPDPGRPINFRNFLNLGYNFSDRLAITGTAYWSYQPFLEQKVQLQDPFIRLSDSSLLREGNFNLYADIRIHFGMSTPSRESDQYFGIQTVEVASYSIPEFRFTLGTYGALRSNFFGKHGNGYDLEMYLGPHISYQLSPTLLATVLYEIRGSHTFGAKFGSLNNDGTDLQPGLSWDVTPKIMLNPYLNLQTGGKVNLSTTSFGLLANWNLF